MRKKKIQDLSARVCEFERERKKKKKKRRRFFLGVLFYGGKTVVLVGLVSRVCVFSILLIVCRFNENSVCVCVFVCLRMKKLLSENLDLYL